MEEVQKSVETSEASAPETEVQNVVKEVEQPDESRAIRALRSERKQLIAELKQQRMMLEELQSRVVTPTPPDELDGISDDDYLKTGHVKKLIAREAQKIASQEAEKLLREREQSKFLDRLKGQFEDFNEVVNPETLSLLEENEPELAQSIAELKDPYKIGLQSYEYIKALGLLDKLPQKRRTREVEKKLEENAKTVQSPQVYDKRPMAQAFRMSEVEKKALYEEMMNYANQAGMGF